MSLIEDPENIIKEIEKSSSDDIHSICNNLGKDVMSGKLELVKTVELLKPLLTSTDTKLREKGVAFLSQTLALLENDFLSAMELTFLATFYCDRLKDHHSLASAVLQGVLALIDMENLPSDSPNLICTSMFANIHCQTLTQPERNMVYRVFQKFLTQRIDDLKQMGVEFVLGFITAIDSERDPQNLMLLFSILPRFLTSFPLLHLTEEAFSVVSCYFPIDFNAAEDDKTHTRDELASALAPCLVAVPEFAEFCIPLVIEKLDSNLRIAKLDSLHVLKEGCEIWNIENIEHHLIDIWLSLKKELLPGNDAEVRSLATLTLSSVILKLNTISDVEKKQSILKSFTADIISSTTGLLSDMNLSLFGPAVHILVTAASASKYVCEKIVSHVIPKLYALPQSTPQETVIIMRTLNLFFKAELQHNSSTGDEFNEVWKVLPKMLISATCQDNFDVKAAGFEGISTLAPSLSTADRDSVYNISVTALSTGNESVMESCIDCLKSLATFYPLEVMDTMVQSKLLIDKGCPDIDKQKWRIATLCAFIALPEFTVPVTEILLNSIEANSPSTNVILKSLRELLENTSLDEPTAKLLCVISTKRLVNWWIGGVQQQVKCSQIFNNEDILKDCAAIVECLIRRQDSSLQAEITSPLLQSIIPADEPGNGLHNSLHNDVASHIHSQVVLLEGLLESLHSDVVIPCWQTLMMALTNLAFNSSQKLTQLSASRLLATLLNKQHKDEKLAVVLGYVAKCLEQKINERNTEINAVRLLSWITKALVLRGHSLMVYWLDKLTDQLSNRRIGKKAAEGFRLIMSEDKLHLTTKSHCTVRILYRQRLFQRVPALVSASRSCHQICKVNYLLAIAYFVQSVPRVVLFPYLRLVVLPMVESLNYDEGELELTTLQTLSSLLAEKESSLESYTDTFILSFVNLAQESPFMKVRIAALECLKNYAYYPSVLLVPYAQAVIAELETCLDDKKRLVRKAAVDARSSWFLVGTQADND